MRYNFNCGVCKFCCVFYRKNGVPVLTEQEKNIIKRVTKYKGIKLQKVIDGYRINTVNGKCEFKQDGCKIYSYRPLDCRLYPFVLGEDKKGIYIDTQCRGAKVFLYDLSQKEKLALKYLKYIKGLSKKVPAVLRAYNEIYLKKNICRLKKIKS